MSIFRREVVLPANSSINEQIEVIMRAFPFQHALVRHNSSVVLTNPAAVTNLETYCADAREALVMAAINVKRGQPVFQTMTRNLIAINMYGKLQLIEVNAYVMMN